jgi:flavodoxin
MEKNKVRTEHHPVTSPLKSLVIMFSYHHINTAKIAQAMAGVMGAAITTPHQVRPEDLKAFDLIGFGSGIYSATAHARPC